MVLRGRRSARAVVDRLLEGVRGGDSGVLVVRGEAGVGKTALLEAALASVVDLRVVRAVGVESEMELAFAALHQLCGPLLDRLVGLPGPQREALEIVFGLSGGQAPDRFLVGLGVLSLLSEVAEERPLVCVVDDAQWLDQASALTLAFVARRLLAEPVAMVFAAREPGQDLRGMPELEVQGLGDADARALLDSVVPWRMDERVRDSIVADTRGNPLALLELPRGLSPAQLAGGFGVTSGLSLSARIEESFLRQFESLPEDTRELVLVAAAEPVGDPALLWGAAAHLGISVEALVPAASAGLLEVDRRVRFRHPLVRSGVYRAASQGERRRVHAALAQVTDPQVDPDRRAWHRAQAASGPDEDVAQELERSAGRAQARGGLAAAAAFLERAAALSADSERAAGRIFAAAAIHTQAGSFEEASALLAAVEGGSLDELAGARVDLLHGQIAFASTAKGEAPRLLLRAAEHLEGIDVGLARETYLDAWAAALFAGRFARGCGLLAVAQAASAAPRSSQPPRPSDVMLDGFATLMTAGCAAAAPILWRALRAFASPELPMEDGLRWGWIALSATFTLWDEENWETVAVAQLHLARDVGALARLPIDLNHLAGSAAWSGDFERSASLVAEAEVVAEATGTRFGSHGAMMMAALRGRETDALTLLDAAAAAATAREDGFTAQLADWLSAVLFNSLGRYQEALASAQRADGEAPELYVSAWARIELVEAAVRTGDDRLAADSVERLAVSTQASGTNFGLGIEARSRASISEGDTADSLYREAIDRLNRTRFRTEAARARLYYGEWLRRQGRRIDAREQLRTCHEMFDEIGMEAFARRAAHELLATGEHARKRIVDTRDDLTAQELQIAQMARDGLTNPEIGTRLFLSPRTVEWHLRKVFTKLNISSRRQLGSALPRRPTNTLTV